MGLGCWQFGGDWGDISEATAAEIMQTSQGQGVTFFDTANVYGAGQSESWIGRFLASQSSASESSISIATKYGRGDVYPDKYSEKDLRETIAGSAKRVGVETLDLVQLHCVPKTVLGQGEIFDWLRRAQADGLLHHFGASVETVEEGLICLEQPGLLSLQVIFNLFRQKPATKLLPEAQSKGVGIIVRLPLASGLLAGKFSAETTFPESDHRNYNRDGQHFNVGETFAGIPFHTGVELADGLREFVPAGLTMAQFAMRWILDHDAVSVIIPGASSAQQASDNAHVSNLPSLPTDLHQQLRDYYQTQVQQHIRGPY